MTGVSIEDVKRWEKVFAEERGFNPRSIEEAEQVIGMFFLHMQEELGEASQAYRNKDYKNMMGELSDILLFIAKISNILDDYYELSPLENILQER